MEHQVAIYSSVHLPRNDYTVYFYSLFDPVSVSLSHFLSFVLYFIPLGTVPRFSILPFLFRDNGLQTRTINLTSSEEKEKIIIKKNIIHIS